MLKKAREYMRQRRAQLLGAHLAGQEKYVLNPSGVLVPRHSGTMCVTPLDRCGGAKGRLIAKIRRPGEDWETVHEGEWEDVFDDDNLVVTQAERLMADAMAGVANSAFNYIELGDPAFPATPPALTDIGLEQTTSQRKAATVTVNGNVVTSEVTFLTSEANGFTYTEAGLFTGPFAGGSMFARKVFNPIVKTVAFELKLTWLVTFLVNPTAGGSAGVVLTGPTVVSPDTVYVATGGEASVAATFDFIVGANLIEVFLNQGRLIRGRQYTEANPALAAPQGGPGNTNKGINFIGFVLQPDDVVYIRLISLAP